MASRPRGKGWLSHMNILEIILRVVIVVIGLSVFVNTMFMDFTLTQKILVGMVAGFGAAIAANIR